MHSFDLLGSYVRGGLRAAWRHRFFSSIILMSLTAAFCAALAVVLFISREVGYDGFFGDSDRIYRFVTTFKLPGRDPIEAAQSSPAAARNLRQAFPEITNAVRLAPAEVGISASPDREFSVPLYYADPSFLEMFDFPVLKGATSGALAAPNSMVVTERMAQMLFGTAEVVGRTVTIDGEHEFMVTAVIENLPQNTHFDFQVLAAFQSPSNGLAGAEFGTWYDITVYTYLQLARDADAQKIRDQFEGYIGDHIPPHPLAAMAPTDYFDFDLEPVGDIHLLSSRAGQMKSGGDAVLVSAMAGVLALILVIACTNYINLGLVVGARRAREVGLRKTVGATRANLIVQFMTESLFFAFLALMLAFLALPLILPLLESLMGAQYFLEKILNVHYVTGAFLVTVSVAALAGTYPMLRLANLVPAKSLAGSRSDSGASNGSRRLRLAAVFIQFIIAVTLIAMTIAIQRQIAFIGQLPLGFTPQNLVVVDDLRPDDAAVLDGALKGELLAHPGITAVTTASVAPPDLVRARVGVQTQGDAAIIGLSQINVGPDFLETYGISVLAGHDFVAANAEGAEILSAIINESAARRLGFKSPLEALERPLLMPTSPGNFIDISVVGVVADFHMRSAREAIEPVIIVQSTGGLGTLALRIVPGTEAIEHLQKTWARVMPGRQLRWSMMADRLAAAYHAEARQLDFFRIFAVLSIFLTVLGLAGMAANLAKERESEIAMRKVFGANAAEIMGLMIWDSLKPVLGACVVAWPIAHVAISSWLGRFAYRVEGELAMTLLVASALSVLVAIVTVAGFTQAAVRSAPATALRHP